MKSVYNMRNHILLFKQDPGGSSDETLKQNIMPLGKGLPNILSLRPVTWKWKNKHQGSELQYGFIAQEVEKVLPHLVTDGVIDGHQKKFLTMSGIVPYLVAAIQEQQAQIASLEKKLEKQ